MKRTDHSKRGSKERLVLIGMIVDTKFLRLVKSKWIPTGLFANKWANTIAKWCIQYCNQNDQAPKRAIQAMFDDWAERTKDKETLDYVEGFLEDLSSEYEHGLEVSSEYLVDVAGRLFNAVAFRNISNEMMDLVDAEKIDEALELHKKHKPIRLGKGQYINLLDDQDAVRNAFEKSFEPPLVEYPGDLGLYLGEDFRSESFISFLGPEKRGKSFVLLDLAWRALLQKRRVAYFELGDLGQEATIRRFAARACQRPLRGGSFSIPKGIDLEGRSAIVTGYRDRNTKPLRWDLAVERFMKVARVRGRDYLHLHCYTAREISAEGVLAELQRTADEEEWTPDVIILDYADLLAPMTKRAESRDQVNETWEYLRRISLDLHCLVVTATQTKAAAYKKDKDLLGMEDFSEDKRKLAHVTGMIGLNSSVDERRAGIMRWNWIVRRNEVCDMEKCVHIAGCLAIANPAIVSIL